MEEQGRKGLGRRIGAKLAGAGRSIKADYQAGGVKKMARNKFFIAACCLIVMMIIGAISDTEKGTLIAKVAPATRGASTSDYGDVPVAFLKSRVIVRNVLDYPEDFTVENLIKNFSKVKYVNGNNPSLGKWEESNNVYSISFITEKGDKAYLVFQQDMSDESKGQYSLFRFKTPFGNLSSDIDAMKFIAYYNLTKETETFKSSPETIASFLHEYGNVPEDFVKSIVLIQDKDEYPEDFTVERIIKNIAGRKNHDGTHPKLGKWQQAGNVYTISITNDPELNFMEVNELVFDHRPNGEGGRNISYFRYKSTGNEMSTPGQAAALIGGYNLTK